MHKPRRPEASVVCTLLLQIFTARYLVNYNLATLLADREPPSVLDRTELALFDAGQQGRKDHRDWISMRTHRLRMAPMVVNLRKRKHQCVA